MDAGREKTERIAANKKAIEMNRKIQMQDLGEKLNARLNSLDDNATRMQKMKDARAATYTDFGTMAADEEGIMEGETRNIAKTQSMHKFTPYRKGNTSAYYDMATSVTDTLTRAPKLPDVETGLRRIEIKQARAKELRDA